MKKCGTCHRNLDIIAWLMKFDNCSTCRRMYAGGVRVKEIIRRRRVD